jgi:hypothetical protein
MNCVFGLIHRLVSQEQTKLRKLKIIDKRTTIHTSTNKSHKDHLLTTEQLTWVHTQTLEASQTQVAISEPASAHFTALEKPRKLKNCIQTKAHAHPHTPLNTRSQKKPRWLISDTATHKPQHAKRGSHNTNINYTQPHNGTQTNSL